MIRTKYGLLAATCSVGVQYDAMTYTAQVFLKPIAKPSHAEASVLRKYLSGSVRKI